MGWIIDLLFGEYNAIGLSGQMRFIDLIQKVQSIFKDDTDYQGHLAKVALKQSTRNSLSSLFYTRFSVFILTMRALVYSYTRFMTIPALLISLCLERKSTWSLSASSLTMACTVLSTLTWYTPWNLGDSSTCGKTSLLALDITKYQLNKYYKQNYNSIQQGWLAAPSSLHYIQIAIYSLMNHQKKLRNIILQLSEPQKIRLLQLYSQNHTALNTHVKKISFNCYESTIQINNHIYNGYGKTHSEALNAGINMLLEAHLKNQANHQALKEALKKLSINPAQECTHDKIKTQPDVLLEKSRVQLVGRTSFGQTRMKQPVSKGAKSIKQQIFQSLNRSCFKKGEQGGNGKVINQSLTKEPSCVLLSQCQPKNQKRQQIQSILNRVRQLQQKLEEALRENEYLKAKVSQKQQLRRQVRGANASSYMRRQASDYMIKRQANDRQAEMSNKNQMNLLYRQSKQAMADITNKMSSLLQNKENYKLRSFSVSNSTHHSNFNSKAMQSKVKIPKLNLQILPNYHGKSNKSLNQSLLDNYEKKVKANGYM